MNASAYADLRARLAAITSWQALHRLCAPIFRRDECSSEQKKKLELLLIMIYEAHGDDSGTRLDYLTEEKVQLVLGANFDRSFVEDIQRLVSVAKNAIVADSEILVTELRDLLLPQVDYVRTTSGLRVALRKAITNLFAA